MFSSAFLKPLKYVTSLHVEQVCIKKIWERSRFSSSFISGSLTGGCSNETRKHPFPTDFLWHIFSVKPQFLSVLSSSDCFMYSESLLYLLLQIVLITWTPTMIFSDYLCVNVIINFTCSNPRLNVCCCQKVQMSFQPKKIILVSAARSFPLWTFAHLN